MTVKELVGFLEKADPDAEVELVISVNDKNLAVLAQGVAHRMAGGEGDFSMSIEDASVYKDKATNKDTVTIYAS